jgi:putative endonuclease
MNQYFVYILQCSDNSYYTRVTNDIERRLWEHETCFYPNAYTSKRLPIKLVFWEKFYSPDHAIEFEKQIKGWSCKKKEAIIAGNWEKLKELSVCINESHHLNYSKAGLILSMPKDAQPDRKIDSTEPDKNKI